MPNGFVEVSGYSETDLENSYQEGLADGESSAVEGTTATQAQVLSGATFSSEVAGHKKTGLMPNQGTKTYTINPGQQQTIPAGYHNGNGYVKANPNQNTGTYTFASGDTGSTKDMGVNNTYRYVNASNVYAKGVADTQVGTAVPADVITGKTFTNANGLQTGTAVWYGRIELTNLEPNTTISTTDKGFFQNIQITTKPNTTTYTVASSLTRSGYTAVDMGIANLNRYVDARPAYDAGVAATKVGTAVASDVRQGKTFTNSSGVNIQGTLVDNAVYSTSLPSAPINNVDMGGLFRYLSSSIVNDLYSRGDGRWVNNATQALVGTYEGSLNGGISDTLVSADAVGDNYNNYILLVVINASCEDSDGHYPGVNIGTTGDTYFDSGTINTRVTNGTRNSQRIRLIYIPKGQKNKQVGFFTDYTANVVAKAYKLGHN